MPSENKPSIKSVVEKAVEAVNEFISKKVETVVGVEESDVGWAVTVEALERKAVPDTQDLLCRYEVRFDPQGRLVGWKQKALRRRSERLYDEKEP